MKKTLEILTPEKALLNIKNTAISTRVGDWGIESAYVKDLSSTQQPFAVLDLALTELAEIKKIPTQEEVCNALEDDTGSTITFKIRKQSDTTQAMFIIGDVEATFLDFIGYNLKYKTVCYSNFEELSPKTLILIMRFFEGYDGILKGETK